MFTAHLFYFLAILAFSSSFPAALPAWNIIDDDCEALSMDRHASNELAQMEYSWMLRDKGLLPFCDSHGACFSPEHGTYPRAAKLAYRFSPRFESSPHGCMRWNVSEMVTARPGPGRNHYPGGTSFLARSQGEISRLCAVLNPLDGTYQIVCSRPRPGSCVFVTVHLMWENYEAFYNHLPGTGSIAGAVKTQSGGSRGLARDKNEYVAKPILREEVCEPVESGARDDSNSLRKGWVSAVRAKEIMPNISLAPWQCDQASGKSPMISAKDWLGSKDGFVWQRSDGSLQEVTHQESDSWRRCLGTPPLQSRKTERCGENRSSGNAAELELLHVMGDSHMSNIAWCFTKEALQLKPSPGKSMSSLDRHAEEKRQGTYGHLEPATYAKLGSEKMALAKYLLGCQGRPQDCLQSIARKDANRFYSSLPEEGASKKDHLSRNDLRGSSSTAPQKEKLKVVLSKITTLGAAAAHLRLWHLIIPKEQAEEDGKPKSGSVSSTESTFGARRVVVVMIGHWDSAAQRDTRELLLGELPVFLKAVRELRQDYNTNQLRIFLDIGPAASGASTGWRNNHALAAVAAFVARALTPSSDESLKVEMALENTDKVLMKPIGTRVQERWLYALPSGASNLSIEMLPVTSLAATMPRMFDTADGLHFCKIADIKAGPGPTGDLYDCNCRVMESFFRLLFDAICPVPPQAPPHESCA